MIRVVELARTAAGGEELGEQNDQGQEQHQHQQPQAQHDGTLQSLGRLLVDDRVVHLLACMHNELARRLHIGLDVVNEGPLGEYEQKSKIFEGFGSKSEITKGI